MLPLFMILAWLLTTAMLCKSIVYEKERRLKEVMKIMGLSNGVHWVAWFINAFVMMFATIILLILLLKVSQKSGGWADFLGPKYYDFLAHLSTKCSR